MMRTLCLQTLILLSFFITHDAHAQKRPDNCGDIKRRHIKGLYKDADEVRYVYDVRGDIEKTCALLEDAEDWIDDRKKDDTLTSDIKESLNVLFDEIGETLKLYENPLKRIDAWLGVDPDGDAVKRVLKRERLTGAKKDLKHIQENLNELLASLTKIITEE